MRDEGGADGGQGVKTSDLWRFTLENWDRFTLPDLTRQYGIDTSDENALLARPWWWLRSHLLALYSIPDSISGRVFTERNKQGE